MAFPEIALYDLRMPLGDPQIRTDVSDQLPRGDPAHQRQRRLEDLT